MSNDSLILIQITQNRHSDHDGASLDVSPWEMRAGDPHADVEIFFNVPYPHIMRFNNAWGGT